MIFIEFAAFLNNRYSEEPLWRVASEAYFGFFLSMYQPLILSSAV